MSQAGKVVWNKIVQERTKNASYKPPQVPRGQHFRAGKAYDVAGLLCHKRKDGSVQ
ncbi:hypothetical protein [Bartonella gabonensis]|uniref:hypothetical protein n=1 Tax=Bartonella gabonensis TaxID=2699889 RepID=UPI001589FF6C|nr:hypothetical protein [Bartonella gabonensis]